MSHVQYSLSYRQYLKAMASKQPDFYEGDASLPVFSKVPSNRKRLLSLEDTVKCILHPVHQSTYLCRKVPITVNHNTIFLIDTDALDDVRDIESDDMGVWRNNRVDTVTVLVSMNKDEVTKVARCSQRMNPGHNQGKYILKRVYRVHGTDKTFRKITATMFGMFVKVKLSCS